MVLQQVALNDAPSKQKLLKLHLCASAKRSPPHTHAKMDASMTISAVVQVAIRILRSNCTIVYREIGMDSLSSLGILLFKKLSIKGRHAILSCSTPACVDIQRMALIVNWHPGEQSELLASDVVTSASANCASVSVPNDKSNNLSVLEKLVQA